MYLKNILPLHLDQTNYNMLPEEYHECSGPVPNHVHSWWIVGVHFSSCDFFQAQKLFENAQQDPNFVQSLGTQVAVNVCPFQMSQNGFTKLSNLWDNQVTDLKLAQPWLPSPNNLNSSWKSWRWDASSLQPNRIFLFFSKYVLFKQKL